MDKDRQGKWICVAAVATAHGIHGAFRLKCFTDRPEDVASYGPLHDEAGNPLFSVEIVGPAKGGVIARSDSVRDRSAAEALRGIRLFVPRAALPAPDKDEFYYSDLEGMDAFREDGGRLGTVTRVVNHGAGDLIEIADDQGGLHIVPFDKASVPVIDLENRRLDIASRPELVAENGR